MISDIEKRFLTEFLLDLKEADLFALAGTTTGGKIAPKDKRDAIECILLHSNCAETILKRKKITKDFLFNYLHAKKVNVLVSDEKPRLIQYILELWNRNAGGPCQQYLPMRTGEIGGSSSVPTFVHNNIILNVTPEQLASCASANISSPLQQSSTSSSVCATPLSSNQKSLELDENTVNALAFKFTEWYYNLLNKNFKGGLIAINSEHFWNDAEFILRLKSRSSFSRNVPISKDNNSLEEEHVTGVNNIIILLNKIKDKYQLYFSPNLCSDGVRGKCDIHGGVLVLACGTLHKDIGQMCGAFEQVFLIFRDPLTVDNWKIKKTELHLISVDHNNMLMAPTINESSLKMCLM
ncbi:uncharacterized protein C3orf38 homolog [Lycorma delicatula]|uniref:uncharacterized protein C3orf38 homolog n=1 Tax=Lycorma delicatula TaxID=130591 RepID=UPI003F519EF2